MEQTYNFKATSFSRFLSSQLVVLSLYNKKLRISYKNKLRELKSAEAGCFKILQLFLFYFIFYSAVGSRFVYSSHTKLYRV